LGAIKYYQVKARVNGPVTVTPGPLGMRFNDASTPRLEVEVVYFTPDGKQRNMNLSGVKIIFESITPGGGRVCVSSETSDYFTLTVPADGRFSMLVPDECRDGFGNSKQAYFRFVAEDSSIFSTGDFVYTVIQDVYNANAGEAITPGNFNSDLKELQDGFGDVAIKAGSAVKKSGEARDLAEEALKKVDSKQDRVEDAVEGNLAVWLDGTTVDSGVSSENVEDAVTLKHSHDNKGLLDALSEDANSGLLHGSNALAYKVDMPDNIDLLEQLRDRSGKLYYGETSIADGNDIKTMNDKIKTLSENEDGVAVSLEYHIVDELPHVFYKNGVKHRYGFGVSGTGGLTFKYEEVTE